MNILTEYARRLIIEKIKEADSKIREADNLLYPQPPKVKFDPHASWRLVRDSAIILEDLIKGLNVSETDECDC